jgi:MFS family permease
VLVTATFLGALIAQASVGPLMDRFGPRPLLLAGIALLTLGTFGILLSPTLWVILAAGVVFGIGFGSLDTGSNVLVAELYTDHNVSVLNSCTSPRIGSGIHRQWHGARLVDSAIPAIWVG